VALGPALDGRRRASDAARRAANEAVLAEAEHRVTAEIDAAEAEALRSRKEKMPPPEDAVTGVYSVRAVPARDEKRPAVAANPRAAAKKSNGRDRAAAAPKSPRAMASRGARRLS